VAIAERRPPPFRDPALPPRCFLFSPLPHFSFISCAHQTIFLKKKKTYGKFFGGTRSETGIFSSKNLNFSLKSNEKTQRKCDAKAAESEETSIPASQLTLKEVFLFLLSLCTLYEAIYFEIDFCVREGLHLRDAEKARIEKCETVSHFQGRATDAGFRCLFSRRLTIVRGRSGHSNVPYFSGDEKFRAFCWPSTRNPGSAG
jgi:hypothetical protein